MRLSAYDGAVRIILPDRGWADGRASRICAPSSHTVAACASSNSRQVSQRALPRFIPAAVATLALLPAGAASAQSGNQIFTFSGFGTAGVVHSSAHEADFTSTIFKPNGAGYTHNWSAYVDSRLGLQMSAQATSKLSAVVQIISEQRYDYSYTPAIEWANLKYQITPELSVRAGRIVLPTFADSDIRKVGYAIPWVRPPGEVYGLLPITNSDGADISYHLTWGDFTDTAQAQFGTNDATLPEAIGGATHSRDVWGLSDTAEYAHFTLHLDYQALHLTVPRNEGLFDAFRELGPQGAVIADLYSPDDKPLITQNIGISYDVGRWFADAELGHAATNFFTGEDTGWYVSAGYRYGQLTPYLMYAERRAAGVELRGVDLSTVPASLMGTAAGLNAALNALLTAAAGAQGTLSMGGRWDFYQNVDLKVQFDHTRLAPGSVGLLINGQPDFRLGSTVSVITATVDFVF